MFNFIKMFFKIVSRKLSYLGIRINCYKVEDIYFFIQDNFFNYFLDSINIQLYIVMVFYLFVELVLECLYKLQKKDWIVNIC